MRGDPVSEWDTTDYTTSNYCKVVDGANVTNTAITHLYMQQKECTALWIKASPQLSEKNLLTLFFFSSSNTGFFCRGEGTDVASRGISGSADNTPKINMTE